MEQITAQQLQTEVKHSAAVPGSPYAVSYNFGTQPIGTALVGTADPADINRAATSQLQNKKIQQAKTQPRRDLPSTSRTQAGRGRYEILLKAHAATALARSDKNLKSIHPTTSEVSKHIASKPVVPPTVSVGVNKQALVKKAGYGALKIGTEIAAEALMGPAATVATSIIAAGVAPKFALPNMQPNARQIAELRNRPPSANALRRENADAVVTSPAPRRDLTLAMEKARGPEVAQRPQMGRRRMSPLLQPAMSA